MRYKESLMKKLYGVLLFLVCISFALAADIDSEMFYGPLWSRSIFIPFSLYYQFPGMKAAVSSPGSVSLGFNLYCGQSFINYLVDNSGPEPVYERIVDFETLTLEKILSYSPVEGIEFGATWRLVLLYGGFLDPLISGFHNLFGLPNNERDSFPENDIYINVPNTNNVYLKLDHPAFGLGDTDLWAKIRLLKTENIILSGLCVVKLPTGSRKLLLGSGYTDAAFGLLFDWYISPVFALYVNGGLVLPYDALDPGTPSAPFIMWNTIFGFEYTAAPGIGLMVQVVFRTSPLYSDFVVIPDTDIDFFITPQVNLLIGLSFRDDAWAFQFYFQEDPLTHNAADILFNISIRYRVF